MLQKQQEDIVQDRSIYEGVYVFTANNHDLGNLDDRDFETYMELFEDMTDVVRYPDLMVYLRCSVGHLASNIEKRGRSYEEQMPLRYLESLNRRYEDFITKQYQGRVLIIEADELDFGAGQVAVGGDQVVVAGLGAHAGFGHGAQADQQVIHRLAEAALVDAAAHGRVALGVEVDEQHALAGGGEAGGEVDAGGRLADAALLVGDAENAGHVRFVSR